VQDGSRTDDGSIDGSGALADGGRTHGVGSARRVLQILLQFTEKRPTATVDELAEAIGTSTANTYRYLSLLKELALVEEHSRGLYTVSPRVFALARAASASLDVASAARPLLLDLSAKTGETALLVRRIGDSIVCLDSVETDQHVRLSFLPGALLPMHRGASAKVMLASLPPAKRSRYLARVTDITPHERDRLEKELARINADGYAESAAEVDEGVWAAAAPILFSGQVVAAISVAAPGYRVDEAQRREIGEHVRAAAAAVSERLTTVLL